jgi:hypothetical protein
MGTVSDSDYIASNDWMTVDNELERMRKEGVVTPFNVISRNLNGGTEENHSHDRDSNWTPAEHASEKIPHELTCSVCANRGVAHITALDHVGI